VAHHSQASQLHRQAAENMTDSGHICYQNMTKHFFLVFSAYLRKKIRSIELFLIFLQAKLANLLYISRLFSTQLI